MKHYNNITILGTIMSLFGAFLIGWFASEYNWWILLLGIPHMFFYIMFNLLIKNLEKVWETIDKKRK